MLNFNGVAIFIQLLHINNNNYHVCVTVTVYDTSLWFNNIVSNVCIICASEYHVKLKRGILRIFNNIIIIIIIILFIKKAHNSCTAVLPHFPHKNSLPMMVLAMYAASLHAHS